MFMRMGGKMKGGEAKIFKVASAGREASRG
jgi:hypothetical protein